MKGALHFLPRPRELAFLPGVLRPGRGDGPLAVHAPRGALVERARSRVASALAPSRARVELRVDPGLALPAEGFELSIAPDGVRLVARDPHGLNWGASALVQLARQRAPELPCLRARDWPDLRQRGYMLDVSRDRVPTMDTLAELVDLLELLRLNQLQLYTEHTFAYRDHRTVWEHASPLTPDEVRTLDGWCVERGIELVPNQNGFGHMERWLRHAPYAPLGEMFGAGQGAGATLAPSAASAAFMHALYAELLPCFASQQLNIGCDEPFELGRGVSKARCLELGKGRVYLDYLLSLVRPLQAQGRTVQFWGDIIGQHRELIPELPREKLLALAWGYEAPLDPGEVPANIRAALANVGADVEAFGGFEVQAKRYTEAGVPFAVCPGTSSWLSLVGRVPNALGNIRDAARTAKAFGAHGLLLTDWGDQGHLQPPSVSLPGLGFAAALAWSTDSEAELELFPALDALVLRDSTGTIGGALARLGALYAATGIRALNASPLALALLRPWKKYEPTWGATDREKLDAVVVELERTRAELAGAAPKGFGGALVARELAQAAALARHGAFRLMHARLGSGPSPTELVDDLAPLIVEQRECWLARSREGGLADSLARLERARAEYES